MRNLTEEFKHFRGQPIEIITEDHRYCGIDVDSDECGVLLIDRCGRLVRLEFRHIEAIVEPQMALRALCRRTDCNCNDHECDKDRDHDRDHDKDCDRDYD